MGQSHDKMVIRQSVGGQLDFGLELTRHMCGNEVGALDACALLEDVVGGVQHLVARVLVTTHEVHLLARTSARAVFVPRCARQRYGHVLVVGVKHHKRD